MDIIKNRTAYIAISAILLIISIGLLLFAKLNLGIDMTGGIQTEYRYDTSLNIEKLKPQVKSLADTITHEDKKVINNVSVYGITGEKVVAVVAGFDTNIDEKTLESLKLDFKTKLLSTLKETDNSIIETKYVNIGKSFGDYIRNTAFITLAIAIVAITLYVAWAFSGVVSGISIFSFAAITIITLFHDVIISAGAYIVTGHFFPEFQIDTFFVTALLTILGYSINDTIVVFDRIRANLKEFGGKKGKAGKDLSEIINLSVKQTLTRSIYTSLTLLFVLFTIFIFGPETISGFVLVMIFGTIVGTYSSIFIASPILYIVNKNKTIGIYKKVEVNPEDKIVV